MWLRQIQGVTFGAKNRVLTRQPYKMSGIPAFGDKNSNLRMLKISSAYFFPLFQVMMEYYHLLHTMSIGFICFGDISSV